MPLGYSFLKKPFVYRHLVFLVLALHVFGVPALGILGLGAPNTFESNYMGPKIKTNISPQSLGIDCQAWGTLIFFFLIFLSTIHYFPKCEDSLVITFFSLTLVIYRKLFFFFIYSVLLDLVTSGLVENFWCSVLLNLLHLDLSNKFISRPSRFGYIRTCRIFYIQTC